MNNKLLLQPTTRSTDDEKLYQFHWEIPNWKKLATTEDRVNNQKFKIILQDNGIFGPNMSVWEIGFKVVDYCSQVWSKETKAAVDVVTRRARVYLKLVNMLAFTKQLQVKTEIQLLDSNGVPCYIDEKNNTLVVGEIIEETNERPDVPARQVDSEPFINSVGSVVYAVSISVMPYHLYKLNEFCKMSGEHMYKNLSALLYNDPNANITVVTKNGAKFPAHKAILRVQCPVFATMFKSEFNESTTGNVGIDDISEDTMKVLLHYFYTGKLLPSWKNEDVVVEFTYAAGKYQLTHVLELLDALLGAENPKNVSHLEVQLLNLADKLSLKNAENQLLRRIVAKMNSIKLSDELFDLFNFDKEASRKNCELQTNDILNIWEHSLGEVNLQDQFNSHGLDLLALVQMKNGLKNIETTLVKGFVEAAGKCASATELFAIFGYGRPDE